MEWFVGGKLNITENCLDRHLKSRKNQVALIWEPNDPSQPYKTFTYQELYHEVCKFANALKTKGIKKGDRVCFYMPMVPELTIGVLACARIGAIHSVVFAGFSAKALADRIKDASCKMVICSDYNARGAKNIPVKQVVDEALRMRCKSVKSVIVHQNTGESVKMRKGRDFWWHDVIKRRRTLAKPKSWTRRTNYSSCTLVDPLENRRESSIRVPAIWFILVLLLKMYFNTREVTSIGVLLTLAGLLAIATSYTVLCWQVLLPLCLKVCLPILTREDFGMSAKSIESPNFILHPPLLGR